jgi:hypothetical protein
MNFSLIQRLLVLASLLITATVFAAGKQYYEYPDAWQFKNNDRMLIYQNGSGSRNLTGSGLKSVIYQTAWTPGQVKVFQATSSSTIPIQITSVTRDRKGVIKYIQWESGAYFIGTPGYNHTYIYPFNGMTNVSRTTPVVVGSYWLTRGVIGKAVTIPGGPVLTVKALRPVGRINGLQNFDFVDYSNPDQSSLDAWYWGTNSVGTLAPNTTYTIRSEMPRLWSGTPGLYSIGTNPCTYKMLNNSSAKIMTNYSTNLCRSTFRTGS